MEEREDQKDRLDFVRNQLNILTEDTKEKIKRVTEEVENKVSSAGREECVHDTAWQINKWICQHVDVEQ